MTWFLCDRRDQSVADGSPPAVSRFEIRSIGQFSDHQSQVCIKSLHLRCFMFPQCWIVGHVLFYFSFSWL